MAGGAALVWLLVIGLAVYAMQPRPQGHAVKWSQRLIMFGGIGLPLLVLTPMLAYGLSLMPKLLADGDGVVVHVAGEQWWWRLQYDAPAYLPDSEPVVAANEIRMPLGERVEFRLSSRDVIHSFWIPALGGKMDMIPGRETRLVLETTRTGRFRGVCAEFCGASHALMAFDVVVMPPADFAAWLAQQAQPAAAPATAEGLAGRTAFFNAGCGACHQVRGTAADGQLGPDLTHVGSRLSLAAGTLPTSRSNFERWLGHTGELKPDVLMPSYTMLDAASIGAISQYLLELK